MVMKMKGSGPFICQMRFTNVSAVLGEVGVGKFEVACLLP
jgi:hypothetical protein